jgi:signal transduction histidine kinase
VLIVDDRPENLVAFRAVIEPLDVEILTAASGKEALLHVLGGDFAVILLDVQMPGLDGLETAELIKKREVSRHIPIILISAISRELAYVFKGYREGVVDYLLKPIDGNILRTKISVFVELYRRAETIKRQESMLTAGKVRDAYLAVIAHELRTPLTTAKMQAQVAARQLGNADGPGVRALSKVTRQIEKLEKLVGDLLDLRRFENGHLSLEHAEFDVCELLEEQRERMQALCGGRWELRVRGPAELRIVADRERIEQVLTNLITNSIRYSPGGGSVEMAVEIAGKVLHLTVADRGIGIPRDKHLVIFEQFARAHESGYGGIGLGLTIARGIVDLHGGRIWVDSTGVAGEGSTFHVEIPVAPGNGRPGAGPRATAPL